jgi:hypothetical protein
MSDTITVGNAQYHPTNQIIELATGGPPTASQLAGWEAYQQAGGSLSSVVTAFVASTAFANMYNDGASISPDAPITAPIAEAIIQPCDWRSYFNSSQCMG